MTGVNAGGTGAGTGGGAGTINPGAGGNSTLPDGGLVGVSTCAVAQPACWDGKDNDMDGKTDLDDGECAGPCDNDEASFATGISGDNKDDLASCKQDCFFDGNSGADEGCQWDLRCDPLRANAKQCKYSMAPNVMCPTTQAESCNKKCRAITPNGCDCFGCCAIPGAPTAVRLTSTCTAASLNDPAKCEPCTQAASCVNTCEKCELCVGKNTLPADCAANPNPTPTGDAGGMSYPEPQCPENTQSCGLGGDVPADGCSGGATCLTGCCVLQIL